MMYLEKKEMFMPFKKAKAKHIQLGIKGENAACDLLRAKGFEILLRNYRCKKGEIDIIARDGSVICFVEVKTRAKTTRSRPAKGLTTKQKARIYKSSKNYIKELGSPKAVCRYDLIELRFDKYDFIEARFWPNHFTAPQKNIYFDE